MCVCVCVRARVCCSVYTKQDKGQTLQPAYIEMKCRKMPSFKEMRLFMCVRAYARAHSYTDPHTFVLYAHMSDSIRTGFNHKPG